MNKTQSNTSCEVCTRIACKQCDWVADNEEIEQIQKELLTACPKCGWQPSSSSTAKKYVSEREKLKKDKLEYLYQCYDSWAKYPLLGSTIRALGKGWKVRIISSNANYPVFEELKQLLKEPDLIDVSIKYKVSSIKYDYNLTLIDGTEKIFNIKPLRDKLLGKTHIMVAGKDRNTDDYDLISDFTSTDLHKHGIIAVTGNGKGKSTTAFGIAVETIINGGKTAIIQWFKEPKGPRGTWSINEHYFPDLLANPEKIQFYPTGAGFYSSPEWDRLKGENAYIEHKTRAEKGINIAKKLISSGEYKTIVLDEFVDTIAEVSKNIPRSLLQLSEIHELLNYAYKYPDTKIIVTGRRVTPEWDDFIKQSIVITEVRHPWSNKHKFAVSGLDF